MKMVQNLEDCNLENKFLKTWRNKKVTAITVVNKIMNARAVATAEAKAADKVETAMMTDIDGVAGLLTTLVDTNDPVPLGDNEIYVITADNTGSLDATKIKNQMCIAKTVWNM
jgi:hypothetical protein